MPIRSIDDLLTDPMSPVAADGGGSPMTSPPATPQPADCDVSQIRRRTLSRCVSPVDIQHDEVQTFNHFMANQGPLRSDNDRRFCL